MNAEVFEIKRVNAGDFLQCARVTVNRRSIYLGLIWTFLHSYLGLVKELKINTFL